MSYSVLCFASYQCLWSQTRKKLPFFFFVLEFNVLFKSLKRGDVCVPYRYANPRPLPSPARMVLDQDCHRTRMPPYHGDAAGAQVAADRMHRRPTPQEEAQTSATDATTTTTATRQVRPVPFPSNINIVITLASKYLHIIISDWQLRHP